MKLLAVVDEQLRLSLEHNLGCGVDYHNSWNEINASKLLEYNYIILQGSCIEDMQNPIILWGIASEIRYFEIPAMFVDLSIEGSSVISQSYSGMKLISYKGNFDNLKLHIRTFAPELFLEDPRYKNSTSSASANARRYEDSAYSQSKANNSKGHSHRPVKEVIDTIVDKGMTSIPLGLPVQGSSHTRNSSASHMESEDNPFDFELSDISSISSVSGISEIIELDDNAQDVLQQSNHSAPKPAEVSGLSIRSQISGSQSRSRLNARTIHRNIKDVMLGSVGFGTIIRVITTITRLKLTGILEIQNETRSVKLEFRQGQPSFSGNPQLIQSALCWTVGEYNFNTSRMLSVSAQPIDVQKLIHTAVNEMFLFNALLRALESEFKKYIILTNYFNADKHDRQTVSAWWEKCSGNVSLSDIMSANSNNLDAVARDIYRSWMCDEICFLQEPASYTIELIYETAQIHVSNQDKRAVSSYGDSSPGESQLNVIRKGLLEVRSSFDKEDGYAILGLKPGCGSKALDDAYYAWINRYHSDRFVRYKDPTFVKLANELLMLMNATYAKLSKRERLSSSSLSAIIEEGSNSGRIGLGRSRVSTISSDDSKHTDLEDLRDSNRHRTSIRPASIITSRSITPQQPKESVNQPRPNINQVVKMSDLMASQRLNPEESAQPSNPSQSNLQVNRDNSDSKLNSQSQSKRNNQSQKPIAPAYVTPKQHFQTAQKKLALGLGQDALTAINCALESDPNNLDYNLCQAYAQALLVQEGREKQLERLIQLRDQLKSEIGGTVGTDENNRNRLFFAYYYTSKLQIMMQMYAEASENLQLANKLNPTDIDTQRCIRFVNMQLDKVSSQEDVKPKSLLAKFKEKFSKPL